MADPSTGPVFGRKPDVMHVEGSGDPIDTGKIHNGDAALALFDNLEDMHEGFEPGEEKKLIRKIDLMILPFLSVCYAFYYVYSRARRLASEKLMNRSIRQLFPTLRSLG